MRARAVDANQPDIVAALRKAGIRVHITSQLGGGFVDIVAYRPETRVLKLIEIKDGSLVPSKRKMTKAEAKFHAAFPAVVVETVEEALRVMKVETK